MSSHIVDWRYLGDALTHAVEARGTSLFSVAGELGIPAATLVALGKHAHLSADAMASLLAWLFPDERPPWIVPISSNSNELIDGFGDRLRDLRKARGLSQEVLAKRLGVTQTSISYWESNKRSPDVAALVALANALSVTVGALFSRR